MPIDKPADGDVSWGAEVRAAIGAVNAAHTIYSTEPPPGLDPLPVSNTADATAIVQSHLDAAATAGGGIVHLGKPGQSIRFLSGITVPAKVQLRSDENTLLDFSQAGEIACITVDDQNFTPLVGIRMDGGNFTPATDTDNASIGISVSGVGLEFRDLHLQYFGRGVDIAHPNTYILRFSGGGIGNCGTCLYADIDGAAVGDAGERIVVDNMTLFNSLLGFHATANGLSLFLENSSIDFCTEMGRLSNATVSMSGVHVETGGTGAGAYLFDATGNPHVLLSNVRVIMGGGRVGVLYHMFRADRGPANYGFGSVRMSNVVAYYVNPLGEASTRFSEEMISWGTGVTEQSIHVPFGLRWAPITAAFASTDGAPVPNGDTVRVSEVDTSTGEVTLTASAAFAGQRWVRVQF